MGELVTKLGLDWRLLLAQVVNFDILLAILTWAVYRPLLKVMGDRQRRIEQGLTDADAAKRKLEEFERWKQEQLQEFRRQAEALLSEANAQAEATKREAVQRATEQAAKIVQQAKFAIAGEQEQMLVELRAQLADLVAQAAGKVIAGKLTREQQRQLVEEAAAALKP